jgi:hypothetical protein
MIRQILMTNSKILLVAAVILFQVTALSLAYESVNEVPSINPVTYPPQAVKPETEAWAYYWLEGRNRAENKGKQSGEQRISG